MASTLVVRFKPLGVGRWLGALLLVFLTACSTSTPSGLVSVQVVPSTADLLVGETHQLDAILHFTGAAPTDDSVTWTSSAPAVAAVDASGLVTALSVGDAVITATANHDGATSGTASVSVAKPTTVAYFMDRVHGEDAARSGLLQLQVGLPDLMVVDFVGMGTRQAFIDLLSEDPPDLAVYMGSAFGTPAAAETALVAWVEAGGSLVYSSWAPPADLLAALGATNSGSWNHATVIFNDVRLSQGIPSVLPLTNPGSAWAAWSSGLTVTAEGTSAAFFDDDDDAVVFANEERTAVVGMLSDTLPAGTGSTFYRNLFSVVLGLTD